MSDINRRVLGAIFGIFATFFVWHFLFAPLCGFALGALFKEHIAYLNIKGQMHSHAAAAIRQNFAVYVAWRWAQLYAADLNLALLGAALSGQIAPAVLLSLRPHQSANWLYARRHMIIVSVVATAAILAATALPLSAWAATTLPAVAVFLVGESLPFVLLAWTRPKGWLRGAALIKHGGNTKAALRSAIKNHRILLAGKAMAVMDEVRHVLIVGISGAGKSVAIHAMMATASARNDRLIVTDPDGKAIGMFMKAGDIILNTADARCANWDILAEIQDDDDYRFLAASCIPYLGGDDDRHWIEACRTIFEACLRNYHAHKLGSGNEFFQALVQYSTEELSELCENTAAHRYFAKGNEKQLGSILGVWTPAVNDLSKMARVSGPPFAIRAWMQSGKGSLFIPYTHKQIESGKGLISCWLSLAISEALTLPDADKRPDDPRLWFFIDELDALGSIHGIKDALVRMRKKGGCTVFGVQSYSQVEKVYGRQDARTIIENCANRLILRCGSSEGGGTARFASEMIGEMEVERQHVTVSRNRGFNTGTGTSRSTQTQRHITRVVMASEIELLPDCNGYLRMSSETEWSRLSFQPLDYPHQADSVVAKASQLNGSSAK